MEKIIDFDPTKDHDFNKEKTEEYLKNAEKELNKEVNKILQEKGSITTIEMGKMFDRIVCGMSEEDIRLKYAYFDYFGIG